MRYTGINIIIDQILGKENLKFGRCLILRFRNFLRVHNFAKMVKNCENGEI